MRLANIILIFAVLALAVPALAMGFPEYDRKEWHPRWEDVNGDCQDTRQEVLIQESIVPVMLSPGGCKVLTGKWVCPYSGKTFTDPRDLDIDHLVPLKEAFLSGGRWWNSTRKHAYANDKILSLTLVAVSRSENRSKGAKDPAEWLPSDPSYHCEYVLQWQIIKKFWELEADNAEIKAIKEIEKRSCTND